MTVNEAIELSKYLKMNYEIFIPVYSPYIALSPLHEIITDKLQWALSEKLMLKSGENKAVYSFKGKWNNPTTENLNQCLYTNDSNSDNWCWERINGNGNIFDFENYLKSNKVDIDYTLLLLCIAIVPFFKCKITSVQELKKRKENLFIDILDYYQLDTTELFEIFERDDDTEEIQIDQILCEDLYKLLYCVLYMFETGDVYEEIYILKIFNNEVTASEYIEGIIKILKECFFTDFDVKEIILILPYLLIYIFDPYCLAYKEYKTVETFWVFKRKMVAKFFRWREKMFLAPDALTSAIENALLVIQSPLFYGELTTSGYTYTQDNLLVWYATESEDFSIVDPLYRLARNIFDILLPYWEEKYGQYFYEPEEVIS